MEFKKKFKGYDPAQVDAYLKELKEKEGKIRTAQKERMDALADENYVLRQELKKYHANEFAISQALIESQNLAKEVKGNADKYSALVLSRAKIFYATWRAYAQTIISTLTREELQAFNALQKRIEDIINAYEGENVQTQMQEVEQEALKEPLVLEPLPEEDDNDDIVYPAPIHIDDEQSLGYAELEKDIADLSAVLMEMKRAASGEDGADVGALGSLDDLDADPDDILGEDKTDSSDAESSADKDDEEKDVGSADDLEASSLENPIKKVAQVADEKIDLMELLKPDDSLEDICADLGLIGVGKKKNKKD